MDRYDLLHRDLYMEPSNDTGLGSIAVAVPTQTEEPTRKKLKTKKKMVPTGSKDIRSFFSGKTKVKGDTNMKETQPRKKMVVISDDSESESESDKPRLNVSFTSDDDNNDPNNVSLPGIPNLDLNSDESDIY